MDARANLAATNGYPASFAQIEREAERIARELDLPPCPAVLLRFRQEFLAPEPDLRKLAALLGSDIGLSATLLKTVNSPFYGLTKKATSIEQALAVLGLHGAANLIAGLLLRRAFAAASGSALERFWDRSAQIARLAAGIAARFSEMNRHEAHTYVLFRDCGMLTMLRKFPDYVELMEKVADTPGVQLARIENIRFNFDHARVACALARSWSLPEPIALSILHHHDFDTAAKSASVADGADRKLVAFGLLAEQIAALHRDEGLCPDWIGAEQFVLKTLDISADQIVALTEELRPAPVLPDRSNSECVTK